MVKKMTTKFGNQKGRNGNELKKFRIEIDCIEYEYFAVDCEGEEGSDSFGGCADISNIRVNGNELPDIDEIEEINTPPTEENLDDTCDNRIVGVREYENEASYSCEIVANSFDVNKLKFVWGGWVLTIEDDKIETGKMLKALIYDGVKYDIEWTGGENNGCEIVWGIDPEDEDIDCADEDDDCDDEE